jgi:hypothetical protein
MRRSLRLALPSSSSIRAKPPRGRPVWDGARRRITLLRCCAAALTLARGLLAGLARARTLPSEHIQAWREVTRARRDLIQARTAARQRLHDELVRVFPEFVRLLSQLPGRADLGSPSVLQVLCADSSAQAFTHAPDHALVTLLRAVSGGRWDATEAAVRQRAASASAASTRALAARSLVVRPCAQQVLHLHAQLVELEAAIQALRDDDVDGRRSAPAPDPRNRTAWGGDDSC